MWVGWLGNISFNLVFESRIYPLGASVSICESLFTQNMYICVSAYLFPE